MLQTIIQGVPNTIANEMVLILLSKINDEDIQANHADKNVVEEENMVQDIVI